ncbi:MAG: type I 3-dehydroquinate dehydratase [Fibrobacteria bacterium]|nr:type I 3-dehydroquinate dehydratase [Fibrobacteria bacterium]
MAPPRAIPVRYEFVGLQNAMNTTSGRTPTAVLVLSGPPNANPLPERVKARVPLVEIRFDLFPQDEWSGLPRLVRRSFPSAKLLATLRLDRDGGRWPDLASRTIALKRLTDLHRWDFIDVEDDSPERERMIGLVREAGAGLVLSRHAFDPRGPEETTDTIAHMLRTASKEGAAVAKWAVRLEEPAATLPGLLRQISEQPDDAPTPAIFPMGPLSEAGRVAAALASGGWGYAHDGSGPAAPGQLSWPTFSALLGSLPRPGRELSGWLKSVEGAVELALSPLEGR